jgi:cytosine/adenosine deaminase-related metal-dependent hydrolase
MLGDEATMYHNYIPKVPDGAARNKQCAGGCCGAMGPNGAFREMGQIAYSRDRMAAAFELWEEAVKRFHDPESGIEIVIGPVTAYSASAEMLRGAAELRKKYDLCGHTHLLETRAQVH